MFERFTDRARRVVVLAQEESRRLGHDYIGTEHLLLGLIREGEGMAARALKSLDVSLDRVRREIEERVGRGEGVSSGHIPFTPRAKKVLEMSLRESLQLGHNYIGTEHILLGLIAEDDGVAAQVLLELGADLDRVRQAVLDLLGASLEGWAPRVGGLRARLRRERSGGSHPRVMTARCPGCGELLGEGTAAYRLTAEPADAEDGEQLAVIVVFCSWCGCSLGVLPA
jgi:ATP-dependent Clp protease ATP-binding subunit ClpA